MKNEEKIELSEKEFKEILNIDGLFTESRKQQILKAMEDGYKNEKCLKCGLKFMADIHFVRCDNDGCPMKSNDVKTLFYKIFGDSE